jgi:hypothetical protein
VDEISNALTALRHALENIVAPAVDASDPIASEQLVSGVRYLDFAIARIDQIHERERFELSHTVELARGIASDSASHRGTNRSDVEKHLDEAVRSSELVLGDPATSTALLRACTAELRALLRRALVAGDATLSERVRKAVLSAAAVYSDFERAWYLPLGFDPAPDEVPPLDEVLMKASTLDRTLPRSGSACE